MHDGPLFEQLSWRDPDGFVVVVEGRILRAVALEKAEQTKDLIRSPWLTRLIANGSIPRTTEATKMPRFMERMESWLWLEHEPLPFPCYPHEITALQLHDAGTLTLQVAIEAVQHGWTLKDASAWNVLFSGGRGVFVDLLSFETPVSSTSWIAYGQFVRHFLLPLMLHRKLGLTPPDIFLANRDGITPERAYQLLNGLGLVSAMAMEHVLLPKWLSRAGGRLIEAQSSGNPRTFDASMARDLLLSTLRRLLGSLGKLRPDPANSTSVWKEYEEDRHHYSEVDLVAKKDFVRQHLQGADTVLDLGCNAGEFSLLAADCGKFVVAADSDHAALSRLYMRIRGHEKRITPILLNIGRPTPAVGWLNKEVSSFVERAAGNFDCVLALGLLHHLLVSERMTLPMWAELLDRLNPKRVIMEWIDPKDRKFRQLAGLNGNLYKYLNVAVFEDCLRKKFNVMAKSPLPCGTRVMYLWSR